MTKRFMSVLFVVFAILTSAVPASAQIRWGYIPQTSEGWYYKIQGNQVGMLISDNLGIVRGLTNQLRREGYRSLRDDLYWNGAYGAYGVPMGRGGFYPMYDRYRQPMGRREATATYGAIGAGAGYAFFGNTRGTVGGAVVGGVVGLLTHRGNGNNQRDNGVIVTPPADQDQQGGVRWASDGTPIAIGTRPNRQEPVSSPPSATGDWRVSNRTSKRAELWDEVRNPNRAVAVLEPGQSIQVLPPQDPNGYKAVLVYSRGGRLTQENAQVRGNDNFNGWDIIAPAVQ